MKSDNETKDGPQAPADSATSPTPTNESLTKLPKPDLPPLVLGADENEATRKVWAENLQAMGLNKRLTRKLMVGGSNTGKYLRKAVAGKIQLVFFMSGVDQLEKAGRVLTKLVQSRLSTTQEKIAAAACLSQVNTAKVRLGEALIDHADECDPDAPPPALPQEQKPPQLAVSFNFPPVQKGPVAADVTDVTTPAKSGE